MRSITVEGKANSSLSPDTIEITLGLESSKLDYSATVEGASAQMNSLVTALKGKVQKSDIKTTRYEISTKYENEKDGNNYKNVFKGYTCAHNVKIIMPRDMTKLGQIIFAITQSGTNPRINLSFVMLDMERAKSELVAQAVESARAKAIIMAAAANVELGEITSMVYGAQSANPSHHENNYDFGGARMLRAAVVDFTPQDIVISEKVTVEWEII